MPIDIPYTVARAVESFEGGGELIRGAVRPFGLYKFLGYVMGAITSVTFLVMLNFLSSAACVITFFSLLCVTLGLFYPEYARKRTIKKLRMNKRVAARSKTKVLNISVYKLYLAVQWFHELQHQYARRRAAVQLGLCSPLSDPDRFHDRMRAHRQDLEDKLAIAAFQLCSRTTSSDACIVPSPTLIKEPELMNRVRFQVDSSDLRDADTVAAELELEAYLEACPAPSQSTSPIQAGRPW